MSDGSHIEWTDATWNPFTGCTKVSPGCDNCYIARTVPFRVAHRAFDKPGVGGTTGVELHPERLGHPLRWRKPRNIFVNSLSDLFHEDVPDKYIARVFGVMAAARRHTFQVLTKRHGRMRNLLTSEAFREQVFVSNNLDQGDVLGDDWPLPNLWLGVSVEDQKRADLRIPALLETPAAVRFLSCEPLLGPVDLDGPLVNGHRPRLTYWLTGRPDWNSDGHIQIGPRIDWVIVGGESGPGARAMHPRWARTIRDQCVDSGVPFFFKQWGEYSLDAPHDGQGRLDYSKGITVAADGTVYQTGDLTYPDGPRRSEAYQKDHGRAGFLTGMHRVGKKAAGRKLDDRSWDQMPEATR